MTIDKERVFFMDESGIQGNSRRSYGRSQNNNAAKKCKPN